MLLLLVAIEESSEVRPEVKDDDAKAVEVGCVISSDQSY